MQIGFRISYHTLDEEVYVVAANLERQGYSGTEVCSECDSMTFQRRDQPAPPFCPVCLHDF